MATPHLGLALDDAAAVAVRVGDDGVEARATAPADGDLGAAAIRALDEIAGAGSRTRAVGVASVTPESAAVAAAVAQLAKKFAGPSAATPAGVAAAVGEAWVGAGRGVGDVVLFAVGIHAIGGIVRGGLPITGARGRAGSVGWLSLNPVEREDYRKVGCVEAEVAAAGIVRRMIWRIKAGDRSRVQDAVNDDLSAITVDHILERGARQRRRLDLGRPRHREVSRHGGREPGRRSPIRRCWCSAASWRLQPISCSNRSASSSARRLPKAMIDGLAIETATLGDEAAAIGAARLAGAAVR